MLDGGGGTEVAAGLAAAAAVADGGRSSAAGATPPLPPRRRASPSGRSYTLTAVAATAIAPVTSAGPATARAVDAAPLRVTASKGGSLSMPRRKWQTGAAQPPALWLATAADCGVVGEHDGRVAPCRPRLAAALRPPRSPAAASE